MLAVNILAKKRDAKVLTSKEIDFIVKQFVAGKLPDYQMAAFLMSVCINGMNQAETFDLTRAMLSSGQVLDLSGISGTKVDKHSTGGVGDKLSLIVVPIVAAAGLKVLKMSGKSLGHTGGTIDKLASIPGFKTKLSMKEIISQINEVGAVFVSQLDDLSIADKKIYALRDQTATVPSVSLIASSIMSKKLATGANAFVFDVKVGSGAFIKSMAEAEELADIMLDIAKKSGKKATALITDMNQPLGKAVGNSLEVKEAIDCLSGKGSREVMELSKAISIEMILTADGTDTYSEAKLKVDSVLNSGEAKEKFAQIIAAQGGNEAVVKNPEKLPLASYEYNYLSKNDGYVSFKDCQLVGEAACLLGAGRSFPGAKIEPGVGLLFHKKQASRVKSGQSLATIYYQDISKLKRAVALLDKAVMVVNQQPGRFLLIKEKLSSE
jgi:pyrimidine-nucleoside phosphorylase